MADFLLLYQGGDPDWMDNVGPEEIQVTCPHERVHLLS